MIILNANLVKMSLQCLLATDFPLEINLYDLAVPSSDIRVKSSEIYLCQLESRQTSHEGGKKVKV